MYLVLLAALIPSLFFYLNRNSNKIPTANVSVGSISTEDTSNPCDLSMEQFRLQQFELTKPLILTDLPTEDRYLLPLKASINSFINDAKTQGDVSEASVYLRRMNNGNWFCINPGIQFSPGSMLKVPILITYLKMAEKNPSLFDKELNLTQDMIPNKKQYVDESHLKPGRYKIRDLINAMIIKSDNYATLLLNNNIDVTMFGNTFSDLGLRRPEMKASSYPMTSKEFGRFLRVLYSASYLSPYNSEYALNLLTQGLYNDGILAGLPAGLKVAHKFGESGDGLNFELHESAIIYQNDSPYMLVVMTRGKDITKLPAVIKGISSTAYNFFNQNS